MSVKRVNGWQTSDGQLFTDERNAIDHQSQIDYFKGCEVFVGQNCYNSMTKSDIEDVLKESPDEIIALAKLAEQLPEL